MYNPVGNQCCTCSINKNYNNVPAWGLLTSYYKRCYLRQTHCEKNDCEGCCFLHLKGCCSSASCCFKWYIFFSPVCYNASCFSKVCKITVVVLQVTPLCCISPQVYSLIKLHLCVRSLNSLTAKSWQDFSWTEHQRATSPPAFFIFSRIVENDEAFQPGYGYLMAQRWGWRGRTAQQECVAAGGCSC